jgi:hypothetical protein
VVEDGSAEEDVANAIEDQIDDSKLGSMPKRNNGKIKKY